MIKSYLLELWNKIKRINNEGSQLMHRGVSWRSFRRFVPGQQAARLASAYSRVFRTGNATEEDCQMVLIDLATKSGFYRVTRKSGADIAYQAGLADGRRELFGHIYNMLRLSPRERAELETATRTDWLMIANSTDANLRSQY